MFNQPIKVMSDYTTNFMSNASRMIGFAGGYEKVYINELRWLAKDLPKTEREQLNYLVDKLERKNAILDLWFDKRGEADVTLESLEKELGLA